MNAREGAQATNNSKAFVLMTTIVAAFGGLLFGYDTGVISGALLFIGDEFGLTDAARQAVVGALLLGAVVGALFAGSVSDRLGRRLCLIGVALVFVIGTLVSALTPSIAVLIAGRLVLGVSVGAASILSAVYISEIAPARVRGTLVSVQGLAIPVGILASYGVNYALSEAEAWRWMLGLGVVPAAILLFGMLPLPESPRWLVKQHRHDEARTVLQRTRESSEEAAEELAAIEEQESLESSTRYRDLFTMPIRPALIVGVGIAFFNQLVGVNAVIYYAPTLLSDAGLGNSAALLSTVGVGTVNVVLSVIALLLVDRVGRRPLLMVGMVGVSVALAALGSAYLLPQGSALANLLLVGGLMVYIAFFAASLGIAIWLMNSEIYPLGVRGKGAAVGSVTHWVLNLLIASTVLTLINTITPTGVFWLFGSFALIGVLFVYFKVPETKGRSLEEIEADLMKGDFVPERHRKGTSSGSQRPRSLAGDGDAEGGGLR